MRLVGAPFQPEHAPFSGFIVTRAIERIGKGRMG
jgi:hypothetical protein